ncbi:MAG: hypothetical protein HPY59_10375 [Anaerolineae bacterium]|nr:hypothetical protein [Anaerolineae bacterium]
MKKFQEVILGGLVVILAAALIHWLARPERGVPLEVLPPPTPGPMMVYITGEVSHPGVYPLPQGSRVNDAVIAAGGLTEKANSIAINLAEKLRDGQKIVIPTKGIITAGETGGDQIQVENFSESAILINLNTATQFELEKLPGIGSEKASQIIDYREEKGPFIKIEDVLKVPGIGDQIFEQIKPFIVVE